MIAALEASLTPACSLYLGAFRLSFFPSFKVPSLEDLCIPHALPKPS